MNIIQFRRRGFGMLVMAIGIGVAGTCAQQIVIGRIEAMPNAPSPYLMRDWKSVARGYDSLLFNTALQGQYLPLSKTYTASVNYPGLTSFGLQSYVGGSLGNGEGINCIPAVVCASLAGIDKSNQHGVDWVSMCREWFNKANGQNLYLNSASAKTGDDWWYETMPNIFFYQLYSLYPATADFSSQFTTIADRWLAAINAMGGSTTPWSLANVQHRAFDLAKMLPNNSGVVEPEAAGAIAWILYQAYVKTGDQKYRIGAEIALESLLVYPTNPSYEQQLPYGAYVAARMNAELGTSYDIPKMLSWCFANGDGTLRQWGVTVGTWGGYDCSGLIGEINHSNDYPFFMNTVEQVGALVPLVRYDDRYARAIGKWVLNAANASRLFFTEYLSDSHQDGAAWGHQYDPGSTIAHEAMRQFNLTNAATTPFATGDAIRNGWGSTNYALYGASHVGIYGAIVETTNVSMILRLDLLKTDYYHTAAYPTYLYFNPYGSDTSVVLDVGGGPHDLYNNVSKSFQGQGVSGPTTVTIPANSAAVIAVVPAGGSLTHDLDKTLIDGVVVDFRSGMPVGNHPPRIKSLSPDSAHVVTGRSVRVFCTTVDPDADSLQASWGCSAGVLTVHGMWADWAAPAQTGQYTVTCTVSDARGGVAAATETLTVVTRTNVPPTILRFNALPRKLQPGTAAVIMCMATDADGDTLSYFWSSASGAIGGGGTAVSWTSPSVAGNYYVRCRVEDGHGGSTTDSIGLEVRDLSIVQTGVLVAYFPFSGNANDASGHGHDGTVINAQVTNDRFGNVASAFAFNGTNASIVVPNDTSLNFQNAMTLNLWIKVSGLYAGREQYPLSHGNWQNRWKLSLSPSTNKLRFTVKNTNGQIRDLDGETSLVLDTTYNITCVYSGSELELYMNGLLDAFTPFSGAINATTSAMTIGQVLPGDNNYDFNGILDDIRLYNYALPLHDIASLAVTSVGSEGTVTIPVDCALAQNFPNPFNPSTKIGYRVSGLGASKAGSGSSGLGSSKTGSGDWGLGSRVVRLTVYDILGREVAVLVNESKPPGNYEVQWDASRRSSGVYICRMSAGDFVQARRMLLLR
jgi:hypothetical protein